jgi:hypothetical protein
MQQVHLIYVKCVPRCGILHVRGLPPATKVTVQEMEEYMTSFEKKMGGFLAPRHDLTDEEAVKLG